MLFHKWKIFANFVTAKFWSGLPVHLKVMKIKLNKAQCCGSGMFILDPGSWFLSIADPTTEIKEERENFVVVLSCFGATNFTKPKLISIGTSTEKDLSQTTTNYIVRNFLPKQLSLRAAIKKMGRGSEIQIQEKFSRIQGLKNHWIPDPEQC
jgi:hypothetical protein